MRGRVITVSVTSLLMDFHAYNFSAHFATKHRRIQNKIFLESDFWLRVMTFLESFLHYTSKTSKKKGYLMFGKVEKYTEWMLANVLLSGKKKKKKRELYQVVPLTLIS